MLAQVQGWGGRINLKRAPENFWGHRSVLYLYCGKFHHCIQLSKSNELYTYKLCNVLYMNYTSMKANQTNSWLIKYVLCLRKWQRFVTPFKKTRVARVVVSSTFLLNSPLCPTMMTNLMNIRRLQTQSSHSSSCSFCARYEIFARAD